MNDTGIEWAHKTWNPVTGCSKVSQGCKNCYAERIFPRVYGARSFNDVVMHEERIHRIAGRGKRIFVNSMSDLFHEKVTFEFIDKVMRVIRESPLNHFLILTKRPLNAQRYFVDKEPPANVWLGVSVENQATADERIPILLETPAAIRWISAEPLLGPINFGNDPFSSRGWLKGWHCEQEPDRNGYPVPIQAQNHRIDWVVVGGESGPNARPMHPDWAKSIRDRCVEVGIPFFFKQWGGFDHQGDHVGKKKAGRLLDGIEWNQFPVAG